MHVDDLPIEQVALQQQNPVEAGVILPPGRVAGGTDGRAARLHVTSRNDAVSVRSANDQKGDTGWMLLRRDSHLAYAPLDLPAGITDGSAEQFRESD